MKKRKPLCLLLVGAMLLSLCACGKGGGKRTVSDKQIREDFEKSDAYGGQSDGFYQLPWDTITDFTITKRLTDLENRRDTVWIKVDVASNTIVGTAYYKMDYTLYNDGWMLDKVLDDATSDWSYMPTTAPAEESIMRYLPDNAQITEVLYEEGDLGATAFYTCTEPHKYCNVTRTGECVFRFYPGYDSGGWSHVGNFNEQISEDWDVDGRWRWDAHMFFDTTVNDYFDLKGFSPYSSTVNGKYYHPSSFGVNGTINPEVSVQGPFKVSHYTDSEGYTKYYIITVPGSGVNFELRYDELWFRSNSAGSATCTRE